MRRLLFATLAGLLAPIVLASPVSAVTPVAASGTFTANITVESITLAPGAGGNCVLTVNGVLTFSGTLVGTATGTTTALILAPCDEVATTPPGTFADVFRFVGDYAGTVGGLPASGPLTYAGVTREGGTITAVIKLRGSSSALLRADAVVAVGGSYRGIAWP
jgi:hypothetical protein